MQALDTPRLKLRPMDVGDAQFVLELLNDAGFIRYIGDRHVRTLDQAREYIAQGPLKSYREFGFGLLLMQLKSDGSGVGMCGMLQRDYLPDPDLGFALLPRYRALGFGSEAARAVLRFAADTLRLKRIAAIVQPDNNGSLRLLRGLGFTMQRTFKLCAEDAELLILSTELKASPAE